MIPTIHDSWTGSTAELEELPGDQVVQEPWDRQHIHATQVIGRLAQVEADGPLDLEL